MTVSGIPGALNLRLVIPGPPQPQQRVRATKRGAHAGVYEPAESRSWKGGAKVVMQAAVWRATHGEGQPWPETTALAVSILAVFALPASAHKKRPVPRAWHLKANADADNLAKAVLDAGNGVLWHDDRLLARVEVEKVIGAQGEAPRVEVSVRALPEAPEVRGVV